MMFGAHCTITHKRLPKNITDFINYVEVCFDMFLSNFREIMHYSMKIIN
jgi:hypothetical protein